MRNSVSSLCDCAAVATAAQALYTLVLISALLCTFGRATPERVLTLVPRANGRAGEMEQR